MNDQGRRRTLASLVEERAPLGPRRAAAVLLPVTREVQRAERRGATPTDLSATDVILDVDGSARVRGDGPSNGIVPGACVGRLFLELLVGRPPLGREDALEPHLTSSLDPATLSLVARSCGDVPGQWPTTSEWIEVLDRLAGSGATPLSPAERSATRRGRVAVIIAVTVLVAVSAIVLVLAPRWWDDATSESSATTAPAAQAAPRGRAEQIEPPAQRLDRS